RVAGQELAHPLDQPRSPRQPGPPEVPAALVAMRDQVEPNRGGRRALQRLADLDKVAERLAHLAAVEADHPGVDPGPGEGRLAGQRLGLRPLRLVVAEDQVPAPAVDVDLRPEIAHRHDGAFDVPARLAIAELRGPGRLVRPGGPPQREVEGVALGVWSDGAEELFLAEL